MARAGKYKFGPFLFEPAEHRFSRNGKKIPIKPKEVLLLEKLVEHPGHLMKREGLIQEIWPDVEENGLDQAISSLRKKLGEDREYIQTVHRKGYRFMNDPKDAIGARVEKQPKGHPSTKADFGAVQPSKRVRDRFRQFFGKAAFESEIRLVFAHRWLNPKLKKHPFLTHHETPTRVKENPVPEGVRGWLAFNDIHAAVHVANAVFRITNRPVQVIYDSNIDGEEFDDCVISFGLGFNGFTCQLAGYCNDRLFKIEWGKSIKDPAIYTDFFSINNVTPTPEPGKDDGIVARIVSRSSPRRPPRISFVCAGRTAAGTAAADYFLANEWPRLLRLYEENGKALNLESMVAVIRHKAAEIGAQDYERTAEIARLDGKQFVHWARADGLPLY